MAKFLFVFATWIALGISSFPLFAQTASINLAHALECRNIGTPTGKSWNDFSESDLPFSLATAKNTQLIKSIELLQGEDSRAKVIELKNPEIIFGVSASKVIVAISESGIQQSVSLNSNDFIKLKSDIEKELSISFKQKDEYLSYFNPKNGIEISLALSNDAENVYLFSCGLNREMYLEVLEKETIEKERIARLEKERIENERVEKENLKILSEGMGYLKNSVQKRKFYVEDLPIYVGFLGFVLLVFCVAGAFFKKAISDVVSPKITNSIVVVFGICSAMALTFAFIQRNKPLFLDPLDASEAQWEKISNLAVESEEYANKFMSYGEFLARSGSERIAIKVAEIYKAGIGKIEANQSKATLFASLTGDRKEINAVNNNPDVDKFLIPPNLNAGLKKFDEIPGQGITIYFLNDSFKRKNELVRYTQAIDTILTAQETNRTFYEHEINCTTRMWRLVGTFPNLDGKWTVHELESSGKWEQPRGANAGFVQQLCS